MERVPVKPQMLRWARERSGKTEDELVGRFPKLAEWERGDLHPTLKQLEAFAQATHTPIGFLFLPNPPVEKVPIPDFRTIGGARVEHPSPDMLETIYTCQQRQEWYRGYARSLREEPLSFVGSVKVSNDITKAAANIREALGFDLDDRRKAPSWTGALREFIAQAETVGVLVMVNGIVGNDTHRRLDPGEFRGFALADDLAPLVFINGSDTKAAQMFTLAHELAHIWLGQTGVDDAQASQLADGKTERWCNQVAAELLVPLAAMRRSFQKDEPLQESVDRLAREFKVSTLVVLRRIHDLGALNTAQFRSAYREELERVAAKQGAGGGDFYRNVKVRVGGRFARALITSTAEGQTLYRDAMRLMGLPKLETFERMAERLEIA